MASQYPFLVTANQEGSLHRILGIVSVELRKYERGEYTKKNCKESELRKSLERIRYQDGREIILAAVFNV